jgi:protein involved in polysaccharide export with SLBB domain
MKRLSTYALMLALAAAPSFAAKNSQSLNFAAPVKVGANEIPAGDYKVTWTGTGDNVQVTIAQNRKSFTVPAKLVDEKHNHKGYVVSREGGADQLQTIQLSNVSLQLETATASGR